RRFLPRRAGVDGRCRSLPLRVARPDWAGGSVVGLHARLCRRVHRPVRARRHADAARIRAAGIRPDRARRLCRVRPRRVSLPSPVLPPASVPPAGVVPVRLRLPRAERRHRPGHPQRPAAAAAGRGRRQVLRVVDVGALPCRPVVAAMPGHPVPVTATAGHRVRTGIDQATTAETGLLSRLRRARSGDAAGAREAVLLLGNYRPAIVMVRALSRTGYRTVLGAGGEGGAEYSRFIDEVWQRPSVTAAPQAMLRALTEMLDRRRDITVIFPVSEECVMFCAAYGEYLVPRVAIASPRPDIVRTCV